VRCIGSAAVLFAAPAGAAALDLGQLDFPNSGAPAAQEAFLTGALLLHSFEYDDAATAFREAQAIDPAFALAYWGEAMTENHPIWVEQDLDGARAALAKLGASREERLAKAPTERERVYLEAVEILYGEGTKEERDLAYEQAMGRWSVAHAEDLEAKAFHALAILGTAQGERDFPIYMKAAALAEEIFAVNPQHPGAAHYLIHSYDDPIHAPLGRRAARVYAEIAPAATHAQHMISHIFLALGDWSGNVAANEKAVAVSEERLRRLGQPQHKRSHHALDWLAYGYLQQGRWAVARERLEAMRADLTAAPEVPNHQWYYAHMRAAYLVETRRWAEAPPRAPLGGVTITAEAADRFVEGWAALERGDRPAAAVETAALRARLAAAEQKVAEGAGGHHTDLFTVSQPRDLDVARVILAELEGLTLEAEGDLAGALARLAEAARLEDAKPLDFGPPEVVKPAHELLGEALLAAGRPAEARAEVARALELAPRRALALLGLARSAAAVGDEAAAAATYQELAVIWAGADQGLPALAEVRARAASPFAGAD
jgi:tetratricopeptide (TPR) repeat protein